MSGTITVKLTAEDLMFIHESIGENVASPEHMSEDERRTSEKIKHAQSKLHARTAKEQ